MSLSAEMRQRRPSAPADSSSSDRHTDEVKTRRRFGGEEEESDGGLRWFIPLIVLACLRHMSATSNIVHDCDEVFNYWEPLHYLVYKSGFQTWEYSSEFALRSYFYIFIHAFVAKPASLFFTEDKVRVFYTVRLFLGLISTITEAALVVALSRKYGKRLGLYTLAMLCLTSGCFFASTSFLPSSFSMYAVTLASALFLFEKYSSSVAVAAAGVILGWPFSVLVFLPIVFYSLKRGNFLRVFFSGFVTSVVLLGLSLLADFQTYGKPTFSIFNLLKYNVTGGSSTLYGTEGLFFYLRNGFNNFNFAFILALVFVGIIKFSRKKYAPDLLIVVSPVYIWLAFMSLQAHKEERFLYPIYPLICVAATAVIDSFPDIFHDKYATEQSILYKIAKGIRPLILGLILCASHSRTFSILNGYSAPLKIYTDLPHHLDDVAPGSVLCVGSEWHRYPSSFFVPSSISQVKWVDDGFGGLLPFPFNGTLGGTKAAPKYFNDRNKASPDQFFKDIEACTFFVELDLKRPTPARGNDLSTWETVAAVPYLDRELSPAMYRSFFIPYKWAENNVFGLYKLLRRIPQTDSE
ncbi:hypothetical protein LUZ60_014443 [Juncus effusus]|nr:hypothetical protein LUZ60_014443 [Juncus effusus]